MFKAGCLFLLCLSSTEIMAENSCVSFLKYAEKINMEKKPDTKLKLAVFICEKLEKISKEMKKLKKESSDIKASNSIEHGVKLCVIARTGVWHNMVAVPKQWTKEMCANYPSQFGNGGNAYYLTCMFGNQYTSGVANSATPPAQNCGW
ncbi:hypothetical protein [Desulfonauticus submarinus]